MAEQDSLVIMQEELRKTQERLATAQQQWAAETDPAKKQNLAAEIRRQQDDYLALTREIKRLPSRSQALPEPTGGSSSSATKTSETTSTRSSTASLSTAAQEAYDSVMGSMPALAASQNQEYASTAKSIDLAQAVLDQTAGIQLQQNSQIERNQAAMNLDPGNANNAVVQAHAAMMDAATRHADALARYNEAQKSGGNLLDALIGGGADQLDEIGRQVNAAAEDYDNAKQVISDSLSLLNTQNTVTRAATSDAQFKLSTTMAAQRKAAADAELAKLQGGNIVQKNAQMIAAANLEQHMTNAEMSQMIKQEKFDAAKLKADQQAELDKKLAEYSTLMGYKTPITSMTLKSRPISEQNIIVNWVERGTFGNTPYEALDSWTKQVGTNWNQLANSGQAGVVAGVSQMIQQIRSKDYNNRAREMAAKSALQSGGTAKTDDVTLNKIASEMYFNDMEADATGLVKGTGSLWSEKYSSTVYSPYVLQIPAFIAALPALKANGAAQGIDGNNTVVKYATQFLQTEPKDTFGNMSVASQKRMLDAIALDIEAKKLDPKKAAADIATFFEVGSRYQAGNLKLEQFGIKVPSMYVVELPKSGMFGRDARFDMRNPADVQTYLGQRAYDINHARPGSLSDLWDIANPLPTLGF